MDDVESYYHMQLGDDSTATFSNMYRINPDNVAANDNEMIGLFSLKKQF